jgi:hypothetical protein
MAGTDSCLMDNSLFTDETVVPESGTRLGYLHFLLFLADNFAN